MKKIKIYRELTVGSRKRRLKATIWNTGKK